MNSIKKLLSVVLAFFMLTVIFCSNVKATTSYVRLESISSIDSTAKYVLGLVKTDGSYFHTSGTSSWLKMGDVTKTTPIEYTLTVSEDKSYFTAVGNVSGTNYYLSLSGTTNKNFKMVTSISDGVKLVLGTSQNVTDKEYAIALLGKTANTLRWNTDDSYGLRCYSGTTGVTVFFYKVVQDSTPSVTVSGDDYVFVDDSINLSFTTENIEEPGTPTWTSSNTDVAVIDTNGTVTGVGYGKTNITATVNGTVSEEKTIVVIPDNTKEISIDTANQICDALVTTTPVKYATYGTVADINGSSPYNVTITDGADSIVVYSYLNGATDVAVNDKVWVSGALVKYSDGETSTNEFSLAEVKHVYDVIFKDGETTYSTLTNVFKGSKIDAPFENPSKEGFEFMYWVDSSETEWDFANDTVTSDLVLTAKWMDSSLTSMTDALNLIDVRAALGYKYDDSTATVVDTFDGTSFAATNTTYTLFSGVKSFSTANYSGKSAYGNKAIQLNSTTPTGIISSTSGGNIKKVTVAWNTNTTSGRTLNVYVSNTPFTSSADLYNTTHVGTIVKGTSTELVIVGDYQYVGVRSGGNALYLDSISFEWEGTTFVNDDFRIKAGIDKDIANVVEGLDGAVYGIEVTQGDKVVKFASTDAAYNTIGDSEYDYVVIDLGQALQNRDRLTAEFTIRAYVTYDGNTYYSETTKSVSVISLLKAYKQMTGEEYQNADGKTPADLVAGTISTLEKLGYNFE